MSESIMRQEVLDLLARGKINIDEAVELLDKTREPERAAERDGPVIKAQVTEEDEISETIKVNENDIAIDESSNDLVPMDTEKAPSEVNNRARKPRWLRIRVANLESGKNKVSVNLPFSMVRFGLGVARVFSPEIEGVNLDEINDMFSSAEEGLLVDVEDAESNEHVQIYLD